MRWVEQRWSPVMCKLSITQNLAGHPTVQTFGDLKFKEVRTRTLQYLHISKTSSRSEETHIVLTGNVYRSLNYMFLSVDAFHKSCVSNHDDHSFAKLQESAQKRCIHLPQRFSRRYYRGLNNWVPYYNYGITIPQNHILIIKAPILPRLGTCGCQGWASHPKDHLQTS